MFLSFEGCHLFVFLDWEFLSFFLDGGFDFIRFDVLEKLHLIAVGICMGVPHPYR